MNYELHYSGGGHGGPYSTVSEAQLAAFRLLHGNRNERSIEIREGVMGPLVARISKTGFRTENEKLYTQFYK